MGLFLGELYTKQKKIILKELLMESLNNWNRYVKLFMIPILVPSFVVHAVSTDLLMLLTWCFCASELFTKYVIKDSDAGRSNCSSFQPLGKLVSSDKHMSAHSAGPHNTVRFGFCLLQYMTVCVIYLTSHVSTLWPVRCSNSICWWTFAHTTLLLPFVSLPGANITFLMYLNIDRPGSM